jgi:hypothetical protein
MDGRRFVAFSESQDSRRSRRGCSRPVAFTRDSRDGVLFDGHSSGDSDGDGTRHSTFEQAGDISPTLGSTASDGRGRHFSQVHRAAVTD